MIVTNYNAIARVSLSLLMGIGGIVLLIYAGLAADPTHVQQAFGIGSALLGGCGLAAWDTHISPTPPADGGTTSATTTQTATATETHDETDALVVPSERFR